MNSFEELQNRVLSLSVTERSRLAIAVLDSLDEEPVDDAVAAAWAKEVLARSAAYSRGELKSVDWRVGLQQVEVDLKKTTPP